MTIPKPNIGLHDQCPAELCYPDRDGPSTIVVEQVSDYIERCWWGSGRRDFYARWTRKYHEDQATAYAAHASAVSRKPMPIGSRFD